MVYTKAEAREKFFGKSSGGNPKEEKAQEPEPPKMVHSREKFFGKASGGTPKEVQVLEPEPPKKSSKKVPNIPAGWEKGKKVYLIDTITPLGEFQAIDMDLVPKTVRGENPSGAAKKVFTRIRKITADSDVLHFYRITLSEDSPSKGEGKFVYDAQTIKLENPKERVIVSKNTNKTSKIPIHYEYKVKAVKEVDEEKKGTKVAPKKTKVTPKVKETKIPVVLDRYQRALNTPVPDDEPEHDEVSEDEPIKAPKGAPKATSRGKA